MGNLNLVKLLEVFYFLYLYYARASSQSAKCFEEAPIVQCAGNLLRYYYDSSEQLCMVFAANRCPGFQHSNYFDSYWECKDDCASGGNGVEEGGLQVRWDGRYHFDCSRTRVCMCPFGVDPSSNERSVCLPCLCNLQSPLPNCHLKCPGGYVKNARGRQVCRCVEPAFACSRCQNFCQYGYELNQNGCHNCECYQPKKFFVNGGPAVNTANYDCSASRKCVCPNGEIEQDILACLPCMCRLNRPVSNCHLTCPGGFVKNARGRSVCRCAKPCRICPNFCSYGYKRDGRGCWICECFTPSPY